MALEIRPITDEEVEQAEYIRAYAFNQQNRQNLADELEMVRRVFPLEWSLASFEDGEMTAFIRTIPMAMRINGHGLSMGAVGPVVSLPQHRRKGHVGALLRRALSDMRDRGQVLSGLHTPHPALYRRFGWEIATERRVFTFSPKDISLQVQPSERGRTRLLQPDDWAQADRVYRQYAAKRNGPVHRGEVWWREGVFIVGGPSVGDVAIWEDGEGEPQGYVVYYQKRHWEDGYPNFWVRELVAQTTDAYLNLVEHLLRHDLAREIELAAPEDDPFLSVVTEAQRVQVKHEYDVMLRIVDVEAALRMRAPVIPGHNVSFTLGLSDKTASWNEGTYRIDVNDGVTTVERTSADADLSTTTTVLAPLFNGYLSVQSAALGGLIDVHNEDAFGQTEAFFATLYRPFCADMF
jgi:predicted acetyltransferase